MAGSTRIKSYAVDSSVMVSFLLSDEKVTQQHNTILSRLKSGKAKFLAPHLLKYEVANAIRTAVLRKRINLQIGIELLKQFQNLKISYFETNLTKTLELAANEGLTFYDASYLRLAKEFNLPLLTLDSKLKQLSDT